MNFKIIICIFSICFYSNFSQATSGYPGVTLAPSLFFYNTDDKNNNNGQATTQHVTFLSARLGSTHSQGMYLGFLYDYSTVEDSNKLLTQKNIGASIGFTFSGSYIVYHYIWDAMKQVTTTSRDTGRGWGLDLGYQHKLTEIFSIGAQFIYRVINCSTRETDGQGNSNVSNDYTTFLPMITTAITI